MIKYIIGLQSPFDGRFSNSRAKCVPFMAVEAVVNTQQL
jgi:hypothetical protein